MLKRVMAIAVACFLGTAAVQAQGNGTDGSQLGFFLGKWTVQGQSRSTPTGAYSTATGNETCAWFSGGPAIVCRETLKDATGETDSIYILSYDPAKKQYTVHGTDNTGAVTSATGVMAAGVWTWNGTVRAADGSATPTRFTFRQAPGGGRTMDVEIQAKGTWSKIVGVTYKQTR